MRLLNKKILVSGASSGIGRATCIRLIDDGASVIAIGRNVEKLKAIKKAVNYPENFEIEVKDLSEDTAELNQWVRLIAKKYGKLDGAVLSAGVLHIAPLRSMTEAQLHEIFQINFEANYWIAKGFCDKRVNSGRFSSLVFISSVSSILGEAGLTSYSASKGALNSFMKSLAKEVSPQGVRINAILPGIVKTELLDKYTTEYLEKAENDYPLGLGKPEDISGVISFLMSEDANWITGVAIPVDGGTTL